MPYSAEYKAAISDNSDTMSFLTTSTVPTSSSQRSDVKVMHRLKKKWIAVIVVLVLVLLAIIASALIVWLKKPTTPTFDKSRNLQQQYNQQNSQGDDIFVIEFANSKHRDSTEKVIVNTEERITETSSPKLNVRANFKTRVSLHKLEIASNLVICLVKNIDKEVEPGELKAAARHLSSIKVNSSETYVITSKPVSSSIKQDLETNKFCPDAPLYFMEDESSAQHEKISVDDIRQEFEENRYRRDILSPDRPGDIHNGNTRYHCGGPIGLAKRSVYYTYTCIKTQNQCYRRLTNERCDECYHGHNLRTRGCWCPITAIETCIKITWRPATRCCTNVYSSPCIYRECAHRAHATNPTGIGP